MDTEQIYCQQDGFKIPPEEIHILIVEANMNTALIEIAMFHMMGVQYVYSSASIVQGLKFADDVFRIDLILIDSTLLHEASIHEWHLLRAHPKLKHARAIAVANAYPASCQVAQQGVVFDGWIETPEDFDSFYRQVQAVFNQ